MTLPPEKQPLPARLTALALAHPVWVIVALVLAQHVPLIWVRGLWWSDEVRHGGVLADLTKEGHFWALTLNGQPYNDKPPLYFWYLAGVQALVGPGAVAFSPALRVRFWPMRLPHGIWRGTWAWIGPARWGRWAC